MQENSQLTSLAGPDSPVKFWNCYIFSLSATSWANLGGSKLMLDMFPTVKRQLLQYFISQYKNSISPYSLSFTESVGYFLKNLNFEKFSTDPNILMSQQNIWEQLLKIYIKPPAGVTKLLLNWKYTVCGALSWIQTNRLIAPSASTRPIITMKVCYPQFRTWIDLLLYMLFDYLLGFIDLLNTAFPRYASFAFAGVCRSLGFAFNTNVSSFISKATPCSVLWCLAWWRWSRSYLFHLTTWTFITHNARNTKFLHKHVKSQFSVRNWDFS